MGGRETDGQAHNKIARAGGGALHCHRYFMGMEGEMMEFIWLADTTVMATASYREAMRAARKQGRRDGYADGLIVGCLGGMLLSLCMVLVLFGRM